jgi:trehalose 6-phosphate phosphatase
MNQSAIQEWPAIKSALRTSPHALLLFDFDGTLTPIVTHRQRVRLGGKTRAVLKALSKKARFTVGVVSGRTLKDVQHMVNLPGLVYAGNHGLEIAGRGLHFTSEEGGRKTIELNHLLADLSDRLKSIPGAEIENKGLSASIHYRRTPPQYMARLRKVFRKMLIPAVRQHRFRLLTGKKSVEIFPSFVWNKGTAVSWIRKQVDPDAVVLYAGDDQTDEDVFRQLHHPDIAIRLGTEEKTVARYWLRHSRDTLRLLERLTHL